MKDQEPAKGVDVFRDAELMKVIGHPLRMRAFTEAVKGAVSAKDLSERFGEPLPKMSYHVRALADAGLLRVVRRTRRRGAIETHYRAIATLEVDDAVMEEAPEDLIASYYATMMRLLSEDVLHAFEGGAASDRDVFMGRAHFVTDAAGRERIAAELRQFYERLAELEEEVRKEPGPDTSEVNLAMIFYEGDRALGRNGPVFISYGSDHIETIPAV